MDDVDYVVDTRRPERQPDPPMLSASYAVCQNCDKSLARNLRCQDCALTKAEDGLLPAGSRLVRY